jgi:predicted glycogen debranching enzyme
MTSSITTPATPEPIVIPCAGRAIADLLEAEWLIANQIGAYASQSVTGCNTRRYHGLLVAATKPPVGRLTALSQLHERLAVGAGTHDLSTFEFPNTIHPRGASLLHEFVNDVVPRLVFRIGALTLTKEILLAEAANAVAVRYTLRGGSGELRVRPFVALRDFHNLRRAHEPNLLTFELTDSGAVVNDRMHPAGALYLAARGASFEPDPQWWYRFHYRADHSRGQDADEDLYCPGCFVMRLADGEPAQFTASLSDPRQVDFDDTAGRRRLHMQELVAGLGSDAGEFCQHLAVASDAFVVRRHFPNLPPSWTVLAGYHWFADWGRDAFIAMPGLLLCTKRFAQAREVFRTFAENISQGMVPNRFDDYSTLAHYNSIDASLWFIIASERYVEATGDMTFWRRTLLPAIQRILDCYQEGTRFDIHADADGLIMGGSYDTQLTWMDVKLGDEAITPRHGKCVEINALWHSAHRILARRCREIDPQLAERSAAKAEMIAQAFNKAFWYDLGEYLCDCLPDGMRDASIRPNQVLAVSLPYSPLPADRQAAVVRLVSQRLLTPMGLRTLDPADPRYRRGYGGSWESRDRAYHQGTVWAWLIGPFIEAYLKVQNFKPFALAQASKWLDGFNDHLRTAGVGYISEIFDGDAPHSPRGCIAQAWSVGEVLRARRLIDEAEGKK